MTTDEILALDPVKDYNLVIKELEKLNIKLRPQNCYKCKHDAYMILLEELNLLPEVELIPTQCYIWKGIKINRNSSPYIIEEFCQAHPKLCKKNNK